MCFYLRFFSMPAYYTPLSAFCQYFFEKILFYFCIALIFSIYLSFSLVFSFAIFIFCSLDERKKL